eukprot:401748-Hanusia_phi.AAC.1
MEGDDSQRILALSSTISWSDSVSPLHLTAFSLVAKRRLPLSPPLGQNVTPQHPYENEWEEGRGLLPTQRAELWNLIENSWHSARARPFHSLLLPLLLLVGFLYFHSATALHPPWDPLFHQTVQPPIPYRLCEHDEPTDLPTVYLHPISTDIVRQASS